MSKITVRLHPSLRQVDLPHEFTGDFTKITYSEAIDLLLSSHATIHEICFLEGKRRPGILYICDGAELGSLGVLDQNIDEGSYLIKVVPVLHGG